MNKTTFKLALAISLLMPFLAMSAPIKNIEILGLNAISRGTVLSYLPVETGDDYTDKTSDKIIRSLYKTQFFKDIEVTQSDQTLKIIVTENPHIKYIDLLNYSEKVFDEDTIGRVLSNMGLTQGKIFNKRRLDKLVKQLKATYISKGYYNVAITKKVEVDSSNRVGIELDISEGEVARIKSMHISGNKIQEEQDLLNLFEIGEPDSSMINYFTEKDHYSKVALDAGVEALTSHYLNLGHLDFKIVDLKSELSKNKQSINIVIQVDEGAEYKVGSIEFTGNMLNESSDGLSKLLTIKTGDIFERKKIIDNIKILTAIYTNQGYAFASVDALTTEDKTTHRIDLKLQISPQQKVYVNRINITGNTRTQDDVVRREIGVYEGGLYSFKELEESIIKLKRLGFFADVKMSASKVQGFDNKINLNFAVEETKTGNFSVGLSHSSDTGAAFNVGVEEKNFLGTGNTLNATTLSSEAVKELKLYFSNPYFTKDNHSINYGIFSHNTDGKELTDTEYKVNEKGGSIGYGVPITQDTRINTTFSMSSRELDCTPAFSVLEPQCGSNDDTEVKLGVAWSNNTLNEYNFPTKGSINRLNVGVALPVADFQYYKLNASHESYRSFAKNLTLQTKVKMGLAQGYNSKELPFFERYYGGGSSSIRGFKFNSLGEKYPNTDDVKGGELSLLMSASVISPLSFVKDSKSMRMNAFVDTGSISTKASDFDFDDFRVSAGVGFVWLTPIGPLGAYVAKPIIKKSTDETKTFEFTIGTSF